ncbi:MAG: phosphoribosylamine--glycine ligase [Desulfobulbus sp.]|jgi:phosphoribosylamine--glycine ligase|nr:phosphoribosylamine--glycine ligase [Desulfobulbus sp.]
MRILVIGSGGREHALVWKLGQSAKTPELFCAPGNAGIRTMATCVDIAANDIPGLLAFALQEGIDLTVVGPEEPLTLGIVDTFQEQGLRIFGPDSKGAVLEGSKVFTKDFLVRHNIPSARYQSFTKRSEAKKYIAASGVPCVVKADGLAAGKGVIIAHTVAEAEQAVDLIIRDKAFGAAGSRVVIEGFLTGEEASFIAFTDGRTVLPLPSSQDHKAAWDNDQGPNTGGMGAYSPAPVMSEALTQRVMEEVMLPTVRGMAAEGRPYTGMLYAGLMIDGDQMNVLEFNCRFGDPECQPLLMRLQSDLVDVFEACIDATLDTVQLEIDPRPSVCVVMASGGYPGPYEAGKVIKGLNKAAKVEGVEVFHAGTVMRDKQTVTKGGRVLGVTAIGTDIREAIDRAYQAVDLIKWSGCAFRRDIGHRALARLQNPVGPVVGIVMGSDSDLSVMRAAAEFLEWAGVAFEMSINSAHRTPGEAVVYARSARERGLKLIIAGAGMAAHLAGVLAAHTTLPVIGVPLDASSLNGLDALLSTVQMPPGIPVATMGIGKAGAKNAAVLAVRILAISNPALQTKIDQHVRDMAEQVAAKNRALTM